MYGKPATRKQHQYLRWLAAKTGTTFTPPRTSLEASAMIEEMQRRRRSGAARSRASDWLYRTTWPLDAETPHRSHQGS